MGFRLFRKDKQKEVRLKELKSILQQEIENHNREVKRFAENNFLNLKKAVDELIDEVESLEVDALPQTLRGVTKNFISMMRKQWQVKEDDALNFFEEVSSRATRLAVSMRKAFRILFAVKVPEFEGINQKVREITSMISKYDEIKNDPNLVEKQQILEKIEELEEIEATISMKKDKVEELEKLKDVAGEEDFGVETDVTEYRKIEEELEKRLSLLESDLQKRLGMIRKPLRIYAHMVGEKMEISGYRDLEKKELQKMAEKTKFEILKGGIQLKESQRENILKSLEFISKGEAKKIIEEIDSLKKELSSLSAKIKTIKSKRRSKLSGEKRRIKKEISSLQHQIEDYMLRKEELKKELIKFTESLPYRIVFQDRR